MSSNQRKVMGPPQTPGRMIQQSPNLFPSLQFSPDIHANQFSAPATAPIHPHERLFWDPSSIDFADPSLPQHYQDPFQLSPAEFSSSFASSSTIVPSSFPVIPTQEQPYDLPTMPRSSSFSHVDGLGFPSSFTTSPRLVAPQVENPSMFLSSPARRFGAVEQGHPRFAHNPAPERLAYHHQIEESRREQELKRSRREQTKQPSIERSVMEALRRPVSPVKNSRPGLKRSSTHSGVHSDRGQQRGVGGRSSPTLLAPSRVQRTGRSSPLKPNPDPISRTQTLSRNSNARRTSLALEIDENGVAMTVVTNKEDVDMDDQTDSETSSIDESDFQMIHSQQNSFAYNDNDRNYGHSKTSSYSTLASGVSGRQSSYHGSNSTRGSDGQHARRKRSALAPQADDVLMEDEAPTGNAQHALRQLIQDRSRSTSTQGSNSNNHILHSSPPIPQGQLAAYNASPTTITDPDLATPSTDRESLPGTLSTRCVCNSSLVDGSIPMIRCDSCTKWLHASCVGFDNYRMPQVYICKFCQNTPRHNSQSRPREPLRSNTLTSASPLAHKSKPPRKR